MTQALCHMDLYVSRTKREVGEGFDNNPEPVEHMPRKAMLPGRLPPKPKQKRPSAMPKARATAKLWQKRSKQVAEVDGDALARAVRSCILHWCQWPLMSPD